MIIFMIIYFVLYINRRDIIIDGLNRNLTDFDKILAVVVRHYNDGYFERVEEKGLIYRLESIAEEVEVDRLVEEINANCTEEEIEIYNKILFGGFDFDEYLKNHTYEEFYLLITKLDVIWPVKITPVRKNGNYVYDEDGNMLMKEERFSFWRLLGWGYAYNHS